MDFKAQLENWTPKIRPWDWGIEMTIRPEMSCLYRGEFKAKKRIKAKGAEFIGFNDDLREQNDFLAKFEIDFHPAIANDLNRSNKILSFISSKGKKRVINLAKTNQKRVFIKRKIGDLSFYGGRFYGAFWQSLSKEDRKLITINLEPVGEELDYKALHPTLAYAIIGATMPAEVYDAERIIFNSYWSDEKWKKVCKKALLISINAKTIQAAYGALATILINEYPALYPIGLIDEWTQRSFATQDSRKIVKVVRTHNKAIGGFFGSDAGIEFQKIDSHLMAEVQKKCRDIGIPILGIHDSILYPASKREFVEPIFFDTFNNLLRNMQEGTFGIAA